MRDARKVSRRCADRSLVDPVQPTPPAPASDAAAPARIAQLEAELADARRRLDGVLAAHPGGLGGLVGVAADELRVVTRLAPPPAQTADLLFAWRVAKFVKSNAIVYCAQGRTLGIGAGQMSRVDSARIAAMKAKQAGLSLAGSVVASDAFFPFRDGLDVVAEHGAVAVIQPGGSVRDAEVIAAADERGIAMVFTGTRHFRH